MKIKTLHPWAVTPSEAVKIQNSLRSHVITRCDFKNIRTIAGVDISVRGDRARAAVVVLRVPDLAPLDYVTVTRRVPFPYIPGLLSFRECPSILAAFERLRVEPDLVMVDGQGLAHPRRFGIACHLGLLLDRPAIGCAKSRLIGGHKEPGERQKEFTYLKWKGDIIGAAVRTRERTRGVFVSIGHRIDLRSSIRWVLECCRGYRLPEPTRLAHHVAAGQILKRVGMSRGACGSGP